MSSTNAKEKPGIEPVVISSMSPSIAAPFDITTHQVKSMSCNDNIISPIEPVTSSSTTLPSRPSPNDTDAIREYRRIRVAACRARKNRLIEDLQDAINANRAILDLPPKDFTKPKSSLKGRTRPKYEPPPEIREGMTKEEITQWKLDERRKRRNEKGRKDKEREDELVQDLNIELLDLEREVRRRNLEPYIMSSTSHLRELKKITVARPVNLTSKARSVPSSSPLVTTPDGKCASLLDQQVPSKSSTADDKAVLDEASLDLVQARDRLCKVDDEVGLSSANLKTATSEKKVSNKEEEAKPKSPNLTTKDEEGTTKPDDIISSELDIDSSISFHPDNIFSSNDEPVFDDIVDDIAVAFPEVVIPLNKEGAVTLNCTTTDPIAELLEIVSTFKNEVTAEQQDDQSIGRFSDPSSDIAHQYEGDDLSAISGVNSTDFLEEIVCCTGKNAKDREVYTKKHAIRTVSMESPTTGDALVPANNPNAFIPDGTDDDTIAQMGCIDFNANDDAFSIEEVIFDEILVAQDDALYERPLFGLEN